MTENVGNYPYVGTTCWKWHRKPHPAASLSSHVDATERGDVSQIPRRAAIVDQLRTGGDARTSDLAQRLGVSAMTIHRDLKALAADGTVELFRGGARLVSTGFNERDVALRRSLNADVKRELAQVAASLVSPGTVVALDDSTTVGAMVQPLLASKPTGIITHSLSVMHEVATSSAAGEQLVLTGLGGRYVAATDSYLGISTCRAMESLNASIAFVSTTSISKQAICHPDEDAAVTKAALLALGERKVLVADSSKFALEGMHHVAALAEFDDIVMDHHATDEQVECLEASGARLHFVPAPPPQLPSH